MLEMIEKTTRQRAKSTAMTGYPQTTTFYGLMENSQNFAKYSDHPNLFALKCSSIIYFIFLNPKISKFIQRKSIKIKSASNRLNKKTTENSKPVVPSLGQICI